MAGLFKKYRDVVLADLTPEGMMFGFLTDSDSNNVCVDHIDLDRLKKRAKDFLKAPAV